MSVGCPAFLVDASLLRVIGNVSYGGRKIMRILFGVFEISGYICVSFKTVVL